MKFFQWLVKVVVGTVLITLISICTTWYVVNMYVEDIFRQYNIPALGKKVQFSEFAARMAEELNIVKPRDGGKQAGDAQKDQSSPSTNPGASSSPSGTSSAGSLDSSFDPAGVNGDSTKDDSVAVMGQVQSDADSQKKDLVLSTEDFARKKEALSSDDKMKLFSLVVSKLPQKEVQQLSVILENGITADELKEVNQTLKNYLNEQEYKQLMDIISKY